MGNIDAPLQRQQPTIGDRAKSSTEVPAIVSSGGDQTTALRLTVSRSRCTACHLCICSPTLLSICFRWRSLVAVSQPVSADARGNQRNSTQSSIDRQWVGDTWQFLPSSYNAFIRRQVTAARPVVVRGHHLAVASVVSATTSSAWGCVRLWLV